MELNNVYILPIGDGKKESILMSMDFMFRTNVTAEQITHAYFYSCERLGIQFHDSRDRSGVPEFDENHMPQYPRYETSQDSELFVYGDNLIHYSDREISIILENGFGEFVTNNRQLFRQNFLDSIDEPFMASDLFHMIMWFISLSLPQNFTYEIIPMPKVLNYNIGMGLFDE